MGKFEKDTGAGRFFKDFKKYHGLPVQDAIFFNQSDLICDMAKHEDFIVMGRCADVVLTNHHIPHISIFITASFDQRVRPYDGNKQLKLQASGTPVKEVR